MAGGKGTRARPFTDILPKPMIPVGTRPLISHIASYLGPLADEIIVITDLAGMGGQIRNYFAGREGRMRFVQDSGAGTGGDLLSARAELAGEREFLLWFADNLCALDVRAMEIQYRKMDCTACVATRSSRREETGFARVESGMVSEFTEKPVTPLPLSECLGIYVLSVDVLDAISAKSGSVNLSYDILEGMAGEGAVCAYDIGDEPWMDIESPAALARNATLASEITRRMAR